ncbi:hypothetical protein B1748_28380 [Paenibacillus sp. MY03]|jgi:hypothetical protein|uniref:Uncharacterized protein n=1 Tax=Paenibacillus agaridevorans TaxID=171404 RepID=A0A2R5EWZ4_9BACL|nr:MULTISPECIES: hypothetical protein [Paenibacillus]OUS70412.1 hypothetical protein B1748_28380 [Paenibacillus sp. MY03]GBG11170.1 hypothetical protein PAT3040_05958 [Paenibacillus agaridevorans]
MSKKPTRLPAAQDGWHVQTTANALSPDKTVIAVNKQGTVLHMQRNGMSAIGKDTLLFVPTTRYTDNIIHHKHQRLNELNNTLTGLTVEG